MLKTVRPYLDGFQHPGTFGTNTLEMSKDVQKMLVNVPYRWLRPCGSIWTSDSSLPELLRRSKDDAFAWPQFFTLERALKSTGNDSEALHIKHGLVVGAFGHGFPLAPC